MPVIAKLRQHWFLVALPLVLLSAWLLGPTNLWPEPTDTHWIKYAGIVGIFLISGLQLSSGALASGLGNWRLHLSIQATAFGLLPLISWLVTMPLEQHPSLAWMRPGLLVIACLPTTITSCVVLTKLARGNEAAALCNATFGNLLGILITPALLLLYLNRDADIAVGPVILKLSLLVIAPVIIGQAIRRLCTEWLQARRRLLSTTSQALLLLIMFTVCLHGFRQQTDLSWSALLLLTLCCIVLRLLYLVVSHGVARLGRFSQPDSNCLVLCASEKTLAMGIPLLAILFAGSPDLAQLSLPLIFFHPLQLFMDGLLADRLAQKVETVC